VRLRNNVVNTNVNAALSEPRIIHYTVGLLVALYRVLQKSLGQGSLMQFLASNLALRSLVNIGQSEKAWIRHVNNTQQQSRVLISLPPPKALRCI
jgi:hypothetical protein